MTYNLFNNKIVLPKKVAIGIGWNVSHSILPTRNMDLDLYSILLQDGKFVDKRDIVGRTRLQHYSGAVQHNGDNNTGFGSGDDEIITVCLEDIPLQYNSIVSAVVLFKNIPSFQHLGNVKNLYLRVFDTETKNVLYLSDVGSERYKKKTSLIFGSFDRLGSGWSFTPICEGTKDINIADVAQRYK